MSKTKEMLCSGCQKQIVASVFSNPATVKCDECKKRKPTRKPKGQQMDEDKIGTGTNCVVCEAPQYDTASGVTCDNGHGGADGIDPFAATMPPAVDGPTGDDKPVGGQSTSKLNPVPWKGASGAWVVPEGFIGTLPDGTKWPVVGVDIAAVGPTVYVPQVEPAPVAQVDPVSNVGSMRENREAKKKEARPFAPATLRQSMITSYLQCPDKMYDQYENGHSEDTVFTKVGTAIHGIMEDYYNAPTQSDEDHQAFVDDLFHKWWTTHAVADWDWYTEWKELVRDYFAKHRERDTNILALELEFGQDRPIVIPVLVGSRVIRVPLSGTIDRIDRIDERTLKITDYKSNMRPWTQAELDNSIQFKLYSLVLPFLKDVLGEFDTIVCSYDMLRLGYEQKVSFTEEEIHEFASWLAMIWEKITGGADREPQLNQYCGFCYKRSSCPVYESVLTDKYQPIVTGDTKVEQLDSEKVQLAQMKKLIEKRADEVDEQLKTLILESGGAIPISDTHEYKLVSQTIHSYPASEVFRILAMNGLADKIPDIVSVGATKLKDLLKVHPVISGPLDEVKQLGYKSPSLTKAKREKPKKETTGYDNTPTYVGD